LPDFRLLAQGKLMAIRRGKFVEGLRRLHAGPPPPISRVNAGNDCRADKGKIRPQNQMLKLSRS
jgi:hypothetical protein